MIILGTGNKEGLWMITSREEKIIKLCYAVASWAHRKGKCNLESNIEGAETANRAIKKYIRELEDYIREDNGMSDLWGKGDV